MYKTRNPILWAVILFSCAFLNAPKAELLVDYAELQGFVGGSTSDPVEGKLVYTVDNNGSTVYFVDLKENPLVRRVCVALDGNIGERDLTVSPDGEHIAYAAGGRIYVAKLEENTQETLELDRNGHESTPSWYVDQSTGKHYIVYVAQGTNDHMAQEISFNPLAKVGDPMKMFECPTWKVDEILEITSLEGGYPSFTPSLRGIMTLETKLEYNGETFEDTQFVTDSVWFGGNWIARKGKCPEMQVGAICTLIHSADYSMGGGISGDGKYMGAQDDGHGMIELETPGIHADKKISNYVWFGSYFGSNNLIMNSKNKDWARDARKGGYCNAHMSPAKPDHFFYACLLHAGRNHTEVYIRRYPTDFEERPFERTYVQIENEGWHIEPEMDVTHFVQPNDKGEIKAMFATNPWFVFAKYHGDNKTPYLYNMADVSNPSYLKIDDTKIGTFYAYIEEDYVPPDTNTTLKSAAITVGTRNLAHRKHVTGNARMYTLSAGGFEGVFMNTQNRVTMNLINARGACVRSAAKNNVKRAVISTTDVAPGMYVVEMTGDAKRLAFPVIVNR